MFIWLLMGCLACCFAFAAQGNSGAGSSGGGDSGAAEGSGNAGDSADTGEIDDPTDDDPAEGGDEGDGDADAEGEDDDGVDADMEEIIAGAAAAGLTPDLVRQLGITTADGLKAYSAHHARLRKQYEASASRPAPQQGTGQAPAQQQNAARKVLEKLALKFGEDVDEGLTGPIGTLNDHYHELAEQLGGQIEELQKAVLEMRGLSEERDFDAFVANLGTDWESLFGKGRSRKLDNQSQEYQNRVKLVEKLIMLRNGNATQPGGGNVSLDDLAEQALALAFNDHRMALERKKWTDLKLRRDRTSTQRPTHSMNGERRNTEARGKAAIAKAAARLGFRVKQ